MKHENSCGVIIAHDSENNIQYLLIQGYGGYWGFPKGRQESGESAMETALRELEEEVGISQVTIRSDLRFFENYIIRRKKGPDVRKKVRYFVGTVNAKHTKRQRSEVKQLGWFGIQDALHLVVPKKRDFLRKVDRYLNCSKKDS